MQFITVTDVSGKLWIINRDFIVSMSPVQAGSSFEGGAEIVVVKGSGHYNVRIDGRTAEGLLPVLLR